MNATATALSQGDFTPAIQSDALLWAHKSQIQLADGPFTIHGRKYQFEPLQSEAKRLCCRKSTQGGWTMIFVLRAFHQMIHEKYPKGILYLFPSDNDVTDFSASRFKPLIQDNPLQIGSFVRDTNRENLKRIGLGHLYFRGARLHEKGAGGRMTSARLFSIPVDAFILDEFNLMKPAVRALVQGRVADSEYKDEVYLGNPSMPDWGIDLVYESESDRRVFMIPCQSCGRETCLELDFPKCLKRKVDSSVFRACVHCGSEIYTDDGHWIPRSPDRSEHMHGYWNSQILQPNTDLTEFLNSWETLDDQENPTQAKTDFYNLRLGMAHIAAENRLTINDLYRICTIDPQLSNHWGPCAMGVDVGNLLHCVIGYRPANVGLRICKVERVSSFNDVYDLAKKFNVSTCVIDREPEIRKVRDFQDAVDFEVFACDYQEQQRKAPAFNEKDGLVVINRTEICDATHDLVTHPGRLELPRRDQEIEQYADEMTNIAKVLEEDEETGSRKYLYRKLGADHYRHATNYFLLAAMRIGVADLDHIQNRPKDAWASGFEDDDHENRGGWMAW